MLTDVGLEAMESDAQRFLYPEDGPATERLARLSRHIAALIAEVRRLRAGVILPGVEESAELAKMLVRKHGNATNHGRRIMVLPNSELTITCPVAPADRAYLIAELQRTPAEELVEFYDPRAGVVGLGSKLKPASEGRPVAAKVSAPDASWPFRAQLTPELLADCVLPGGDASYAAESCRREFVPGSPLNPGNPDADAPHVVE